MSDLFPDSNKQSNFSTTLKLEGIQIDMRTNGAHGIIASGAHVHHYYEVQAALSGEYCIEFEDKQLRITAPDTLCLIPPNCSHRSRYAGEGALQIGLDFACRQRSGQTVISPLAEAAALLPADEPVLLTGVEPLCVALRLFAEELTEPELASELLLESLLRQFYIQLFRCLKKQSTSENSQTDAQAEYNLQNDRYNKVELFFHNHYAKAVTESDLADALAVSKRQTSRILRQLCGKSFHEKLEEIRMHYALQYLLQTDTPVETIAFKVGYSSASGFFVAFKKRFHMTPTEYRRAEGLRRPDQQTGKSHKP